ncbi:hypothetical protein Poli38472_005125 [Pythium oligandrum]|uniref:Flavodoxin-like domain-containing protein n=1 Tax=Pythium oligandrum TaxID=41045 RepID=A0A8K1FK68_PYTOL|nr:hypothetical protein Poli38472_005124 [Pythium oligandrum]TMW62507.1 hypothetical protein Poli38472_005125 [Pythium oligandrum]|eukprot:TMW62506.1 hypothetical protein Poli38472_005124 [Pythium oligandrum]
MTKIAIVYYSNYGTLVKLAETLKEGIEKVPGVTASIYQIPETLSEDTLNKLESIPKADYPVVTFDDLKEADGVLFGIPTRFGIAAGQVSSFFSSTAGLWATGALVGKPAGIFFATGSLGGGQESTAYSTLPFLVHQGMIFVPLGYRAMSLMSLEEVHGGSPWGAGSLSGHHGARKPTALELDVAMTQGESFAKVTQKLAN